MRTSLVPGPRRCELENDSIEEQPHTLIQPGDVRGRRWRILEGNTEEIKARSVGLMWTYESKLKTGEDGAVMRRLFIVDGSAKFQS